MFLVLSLVLPYVEEDEFYTAFELKITRVFFKIN